MIEIKSVNLEVNKDTIRKYKSHVPSELIEIWEKYGYGEMLDGYLRFINPDDYTNLVDETCMYRQKSIPIITTAFGDVITIFNGKYIDIIKYRYGFYYLIAAELKAFIRDLCDIYTVKTTFELDKFKEAVETLGGVEHDECFCYVPLLGLGGAEKVSNIQKGKTREHIEMISQLVGKAQYKAVLPD